MSATADHAGNLLADDKARYSYDAEGLRHEMEENGSLVKFIFNPDREAVVEESSSSLTRYIRSSELIARNTDAARTYYHYVSDEMGSTTHIVDEDGIILNHYTYDAWGNLTAQEEAVPNRFKFTGQQLDPVTQQYYLRARFYNPVIARFTQEDTYRGDGLNLYAYCANRPTYYIDPTGHWCDTKQDTFNKLASERGLDPDKMDYDTKQRLMAEASNIVKGKNSTSPTQLYLPALSSQCKVAGKDGFIRYGELDSLGRPTGIYSVITKDMINSGTDASRYIYPPGFNGGGPGSSGHARGHLLAKQLGGSGRDPRNLVTLFQNGPNSPEMRNYETSVRRAVESGEIVFYKVTPIYNSNNLIPTGITIEATSTKSFNLFVSILNRKKS